MLGPRVRHRAAIKRSISAEGTIFGEDAEETGRREAHLETAAALEDDGVEVTA